MNFEDRNNRIVEAYRTERNATVVAEQFELTKERVRQILNKAQEPILSGNAVSRRVPKNPRKKEHEERDARIAAFLNGTGKLGREAATEFGLSTPRIYQIARAYGIKLRGKPGGCWGNGRNGPQKRTQEILEWLPKGEITYRDLEAACEKFGVKYESLRKTLGDHGRYMVECRPMPRARQTIEIENLLKNGAEVEALAKQFKKQPSAIRFIKQRAGI